LMLGQVSSTLWIQELSEQRIRSHCVLSNLRSEFLPTVSTQTCGQCT
jgi:hypothetical protein